MSPQFFRRKPIARALMEADQGVTLRRVLGPVQLTSLGIGGIIGAGIFVTTGRVAALEAGPAVMVSYLIAALACLLAALCYSEFASRAPVTGSAYSYAYVSLGELAAWMIGWDLVLEYSMSCATVAAAWSEYFNEFMFVTCGIRIPEYLCSDPFSKPGAWFNLPAVVIMGLSTCVLLRGIRESALVNTLLVVVKVFVVLFVIVVGFRYIAPENWTTIPVPEKVIQKETDSSWGVFGLLGGDRLLKRFDSATRSSFMPYGISGVMFGAAIVFFAFIGFDSISAYAEETKRPQRDVPLSTLGSLFVCALLYIAVSAVITGMQPYPQIDTEAAIAAAFTQRAETTQSSFLRVSSALIALGALAGMTSVILMTFLGQTRIFLAMARDGLLPQKLFSYIHPEFRTPSRSTLLTGVFVALVAAFTPITKLEEMVNIGTLLAFAIVCAAVLVLRWREPVDRGFRVPAINIVAPCGVLVNVMLMLFLPVSSWYRLLVWMLIGLLIYLAYGAKHSRLRLVDVSEK